MGISAQTNLHSMPEMDPNVWLTVNSTQQINIFKKFYSDAVTLKHKFTGVQLDRYQIQFQNQESQKKYKYSCEKRQNIQQIVNIVFYTKYTDQKMCTSTLKSHVYTEHFANRFSDIPCIAQLEGLYILWSCLIGFGELYKQRGYFQICQQLIGFNTSGQCKVWINSDYSKQEPLIQDPNTLTPLSVYNRTQKYMIERLIKLIQGKLTNKIFGTFSQYLTKKYQKISMNFNTCKNFLIKYSNQNKIILPQRCHSLICIQIPHSENQREKQKKYLQVPQSRKRQQKNKIIQESKSTLNTRGSQKMVSPNKNCSTYTFSHNQGLIYDKTNTEMKDFEKIRINLSNTKKLSPNKIQKVNPNNSSNSINHQSNNGLKLYSNLNSNPNPNILINTTSATKLQSPRKKVQNQRYQTQGLTQLKKIKNNILYSTFNFSNGNQNTFSGNFNKKKSKKNNTSLEMGAQKAFNLQQSRTVQVLWEEEDENKNERMEYILNRPKNYLRATLAEQLKIYPQQSYDILPTKKRSRSNSINTKDRLLKRLIQKPMSNHNIYQREQITNSPEHQSYELEYEQTPSFQKYKQRNTAQHQKNTNKIQKYQTKHQNSNNFHILNIKSSQNLLQNSSSSRHIFGLDKKYQSDIKTNVTTKTHSNITDNTNTHTSSNINSDFAGQSSLYSKSKTINFKKEKSFTQMRNLIQFKGNSEGIQKNNQKFINVRSTAQPNKNLLINFSKQTQKCKINTQTKNLNYYPQFTPYSSQLVRPHKNPIKKLLTGSVQPLSIRSPEKTKHKIGRYQTVNSSFKIDPVIASDLVKYMQK